MILTLYAVLWKQYYETKDCSLIHSLLCTVHVCLYNAAKLVFYYVKSDYIF
jgi:hypothetical protein